MPSCPSCNSRLEYATVLSSTFSAPVNIVCPSCRRELEGDADVRRYGALSFLSGAAFAAFLLAGAIAHLPLLPLAGLCMGGTFFASFYYARLAHSEGTYRLRR